MIRQEVIFSDSQMDELVRLRRELRDALDAMATASTSAAWRRASDSSQFLRRRLCEIVLAAGVYSVDAESDQAADEQRQTHREGQHWLNDLMDAANGESVEIPTDGNDDEPAFTLEEARRFVQLHGDEVDAVMEEARQFLRTHRADPNQNGE